MKTYSLLLTRDGDSGYTVTVPGLPGCVTQGDTLEECAANAREAIALYCSEVVSRGVRTTDEPAGPSGCGDSRHV